MVQQDEELEIERLFEMARELFTSLEQTRRDAAFLFFRDVWQVNRIWRAFHDPVNEAGEVLGVAKLLGVHRNTVSRKMRQLGLAPADFLEARSVSRLIINSATLARQQHSLMDMWREERESLSAIAKFD